MILVDTSVWIDHFNKADATLQRILDQGKVATHPFVIGELAMGNLKQRDPILGALQNLPQVKLAQDAEVLHFTKLRKLYGLGIGYVDAHLIASVAITLSARIWTRDKRLLEVAKKLSLAFEPSQQAVVIPISQP